RLNHEHYTPFEALFTLEEGRAGVIVTFMAILELAKEAMIEIVQNAPLSPIHVRARTPRETPEEEAYDDGTGVESPFAEEPYVEVPYAEATWGEEEQSMSRGDDTA
ncbi:MAG: segregation/condensation protein A, partial [Halomonas sp.]|nr:segregation/condensation protein A [Halomonas sp.]